MTKNMYKKIKNDYKNIHDDGYDIAHDTAFLFQCQDEIEDSVPHIMHHSETRYTELKTKTGVLLIDVYILCYYLR